MWKKVGKYVMNVLISLDQLGNTIICGDPDETISSRVGKMKRKYEGHIPHSRFFPHLLDKILEKVDKNHVIDAIEEDEGKDQIKKDWKD